MWRTCRSRELRIPERDIRRAECERRAACHLSKLPIKWYGLKRPHRQDSTASGQQNMSDGDIGNTEKDNEEGGLVGLADIRVEA